MAAAVLTLIQKNPRRLVYTLAGAAASTVITASPWTDAAEGPLKRVLGEACGADATARSQLGLQTAAADPEDHRVRTFAVPAAAGSMPTITPKAAGGHPTIDLTPVGAGTACDPTIIVIEFTGDVLPNLATSV